MSHEFLPILLLFIVVSGFVVGSLIITQILGPQRKAAHKDDVFECGVASVGDARVPFPVKYFLIAILFVLFDVEVIFFYPWALNFRGLGWLGFAEVLCFTGLGAVAFFYILTHRVFEFQEGDK